MNDPVERFLARLTTGEATLLAFLGGVFLLAAGIAIGGAFGTLA